MQGDSVLFNYRGQIAEMALRNRLPAASIQRELAEAGFLLSYGADIPDLYRRAAVFVDKILAQLLRVRPETSRWIAEFSEHEAD